MAKINLEEFFAGATQALTGAIAGQMQGEQIRRQRDTEMLSQLLQADQTRMQREDSLRQRTLGILPQLDPTSANTALQYGMGQSAFSPATIETARRVNPPLAQSIRTPVTQAPALKMRGFDPKQASKVLTDIQAELKPLDDMELDPETRRRVSSIIGRAPAEIRTPEDFQTAAQALRDLRIETQGMGLRLADAGEKKLQADQDDFLKTREWLDKQGDETWWNQVGGMLEAEKSIGARRKGRGNISVYLAPHEKDIQAIQELQQTDPEEAARQVTALRGRLQARLSPKDEGQASKEIRDHIATLNPLTVTPELVRDMYKNWRGKDVSYLIQGLSDDQLRVGDAALYRRLGQLKNSLAQWVNVDTKAQQYIVDELVDLQKRLGIDIPIPETVQRTLTPAQVEAIEASKQQREIRAAKEKRDIEAARRDEEAHRAQMAKLRREREQKTGKFTDVQKAKLDAAENALIQARADTRLHAVSPARVDLSGPRPENPRQAAFYDFAQRRVEAEMRLYHTQKELGLNPKQPDLSMWERKKPAATPEAPKEEGWLQRKWRETKERVMGGTTAPAPSGAQDVTRERRLRIIQRMRSRFPDITQAEINEEMRRRKMLPTR